MVKKMEYSIEYSNGILLEYPTEYEFHEMEYSKKIAQYDNVEFFWNMENSWNIPE